MHNLILKIGAVLKEKFFSVSFRKLLLTIVLNPLMLFEVLFMIFGPTDDVSYDPVRLIFITILILAPINFTICYLLQFSKVKYKYGVTYMIGFFLLGILPATLFE
jgi:hypothetical protein